MTQPQRLKSGGRINRNRTIAFTFDGETYRGHPGDTLAAALMANGVKIVGRSFKYHRPRGIMSAGVEESGALVTVYGRDGDPARRDPNTRATTQEIFPGLKAAGQNAWPSVRRDFGAINNLFGRFFAAGFYYKMFIGPGRGTWAWMQYEKLIRRAAGMGSASREPDPDVYDSVNAYCDVLVCGGGPAGLSAAIAAAEQGLDVTLADQDFELGGAMLNDPTQETARFDLVARAKAAGVQMLTRATVIGLYDDGFAAVNQRLTDHKSSLSSHAPRQRLHQIRARRIIVASGAIERGFAFGDNDRPGVMTASAARAYVTRFGVSPGKTAIVATNNDSAYDAALALAESGAAVIVLDSREAPPPALRARLQMANVTVQVNAVPVRAHGKTLRAVTWGRWDGETAEPAARIPCDLLAVSGGWSPVVHLTSQRGARPVYNAELAAFLPGDLPAHEPVDVCGSAAGLWDHAACLASGQAAGQAAAYALGHGDAPAARPEPSDALRLAPLWEVTTPGKSLKSFVDPQHDVTADDIRLSHQEGFTAVEHLKRYTTLGMAADQGKTGNVVALGVLAAATGQTVAAAGTTVFRPPYTPTPLGPLAGAARGAHFRPLRRTPLHDWNIAHGAVMTEAGLWRRPWYYPEQGEDVNAAYIREMKAVREHVGLCDVTSLGKIAVQGPDAAAFLNRVYVNGFAKLPIGKARYGVMLRDDGIPFDDGTAWRLSEHDYFVTATTAAAARVMAWFEELLETRWPELRVRVDSITDMWAGVSVAGPKARRVLEQTIAGIDFSNAAFPFMGVRAGTLNGAPCRVARISFSGELGYEVYVPSDYGPAMMDALWPAARAMGGRLYGLEALGGLRIEKGFVTHAEMDGRVSLSDLGLGAMASRKKDFIGKALMYRPELMRDDRPRLCGLHPIDRSARLAGGSILCRPDRISGQGVGWVSAATFSPSLGHWIAMGFISGGPEAWRGKTAVMADPVRGRETPVEVVSPVFIDPQGARAFMDDVIAADHVGALDSYAEIPFETRLLRISACKGRPLWRIAAWPETLSQVGAQAAQWAGVDAAPGPGRSAVGERGTLLRVQPLAWRLYEGDPGDLPLDHGTTLDIAHGWQSIKLNGPGARAVLARLTPIDLRDRALPVGGVCATMAHHVGVTVWRKGDDMYKLFAPRTFAAALAEAAVEAAHMAQA